MTKQEIMARINQAEQQLNELKAELEKLEREPSFERLPEGKKYYTIQGNGGQFFVNDWQESSTLFDKFCHYYNDYFYTGERAREVLEKINFLLKLERFHDIYCPSYKPDWHSIDNKYYVFYNNAYQKYNVECVQSFEDLTRTYFPDQKTAQAVCDRLNEELKNADA